MADDDGGDAKQRAVQALRGLRKSTALPRPLGFLTGETVPVEGRVAPPKTMGGRVRTHQTVRDQAPPALSWPSASAA